KGVSLIEVMVASLVVAIITGILLRNYISEKQREVYRNLAQVVVAFDKGVYDVSVSVQAVNTDLRPILNTLNQSVDNSGNNFGITYLPSQLVCPLKYTRSWITKDNFPNDYNNLNAKVPVNFLDPRLQADKLDDKYSITAWYRAVDGDGNQDNGISPNPNTKRYRYAVFELEIKHRDGSGLTDAESDILYALLNDKFCVESSNGVGHYALAGGHFGNTDKKFCPSSSSASYYTVELQSYNCQ
ncbi:MAG: prepilin-type N-terminal cleavage/methylation domain-containing protein, partial [Sulfurihydrogenibium sp.]|nr:prepilin-type N-terminal cleavage/methylation domain-containing protein [Sulfurihydrogenibium sp.]